jgi:hypothetical protein
MRRRISACVPVEGDRGILVDLVCAPVPPTPTARIRYSEYNRSQALGKHPIRGQFLVTSLGLIWRCKTLQRWFN